jgi:hypothetical protein
MMGNCNVEVERVEGSKLPLSGLYRNRANDSANSLILKGLHRQCSLRLFWGEF